MIRIFSNLKLKDWLLILVIIGLIYAQVWLDLKMPDYMSEITKLVQTEGSHMNDIISSMPINNLLEIFFILHFLV